MALGVKGQVRGLDLSHPQNELFCVSEEQTVDRMQKQSWVRYPRLESPGSVGPQREIDGMGWGRSYPVPEDQQWSLGILNSHFTKLAWFLKKKKKSVVCKAKVGRESVLRDNGKTDHGYRQWGAEIGSWFNGGKHHFEGSWRQLDKSEYEPEISPQ